MSKCGVCSKNTPGVGKAPKREAGEPGEDDRSILQAHRGQVVAAVHSGTPIQLNVLPSLEISVGQDMHLYRKHDRSSSPHSAFTTAPGVYNGQDVGGDLFASLRSVCSKCGLGEQHRDVRTFCLGGMLTPFLLACYAGNLYLTGYVLDLCDLLHNPEVGAGDGGETLGEHVELRRRVLCQVDAFGRTPLILAALHDTELAYPQNHFLRISEPVRKLFYASYLALLLLSPSLRAPGVLVSYLSWLMCIYYSLQLNRTRSFRLRRVMIYLVAV